MGLGSGSFGGGPFGGGPFGGLPAVVSGGEVVPKKLGLGPNIPPGGQLVPLTTEPNQTVTVSLNIDGTVADYFLDLHYNEIAGYWTMSITDSAGNLLLDSVPFVTGSIPAGNILGQFAHLGIGSAFIVNASSLDVQDYPGIATLGNAFVLIWSNTPDS